MGRLKGEILLDEKKVRALRKEMRKDENIPSRTKAEIELVLKMALRYIKWTQRFYKLYGKYEECFPDIARGICETFYTDDRELAACFRISPTMIKEWQAYYPDFREQIRTGRRRFISQEGSDVCRRRWFHLKFARIAKNVCDIFKPTKRQLARCFELAGCFEIETRTWKQLESWMKEYCYKTTYTRLEDIHHQVFVKTVGRLCMEFEMDNGQLARCLGIDEEELDKWMKSDYLFRNEINYARMPGVDIFPNTLQMKNEPEENDNSE